MLGVSSDYGFLILGIVEISPDQNSIQTVNFLLINAKTGDIISFIEDENFDIVLTKREQEILELANEGLLNKETQTDYRLASIPLTDTGRIFSGKWTFKT
ncbi:hypothetical protein FACS1894169_11970 [Bacteroidia bacterium]|nr:hypothetical protein FACS1894169_11970 [Bacteroidia bacterium]